MIVKEGKIHILFVDRLFERPGLVIYEVGTDNPGVRLYSTMGCKINLAELAGHFPDKDLTSVRLPEPAGSGRIMVITEEASAYSIMVVIFKQTLHERSSGRTTLYREEGSQHAVDVAEEAP